MPGSQSGPGWGQLVGPSPVPLIGSAVLPTQESSGHGAPGEVHSPSSSVPRNFLPSLTQRSTGYGGTIFLHF